MGTSSDKKGTAAAQASVDVNAVPAELAKSLSQVEWDNIVQRNFKSNSVRVKTVHAARLLTQDLTNHKNWSKQKFDGIFALVGIKTGEFSPPMGKKAIKHELINFQIQMLDLNGNSINTELLYKISPGNGKSNPMEIDYAGSSMQFYGKNGIKCYRFCSPDICKKVQTRIKQILKREVFASSNMQLLKYEDIGDGDEVGKIGLAKSIYSSRKLKATPTQAPMRPPMHRPTNTKPIASQSNPASPQPAKIKTSTTLSPAPASAPHAVPLVTKAPSTQMNIETVSPKPIPAAPIEPSRAPMPNNKPPVPMKPPSLPPQPQKPLVQSPTLPKPDLKPAEHESVKTPANKKEKKKGGWFSRDKSKSKESSSSQISTPPPSMPPPIAKKSAPIAPPPPAPAMSAPSTPRAPAKHPSTPPPVKLPAKQAVVPEFSEMPPPPPPLQNISPKPSVPTMQEPANSVQDNTKQPTTMPSTPVDSSRGDLLQSIRSGTVLKKVATQDVTVNRANSPRGDLLQSIRSGTVLRKVDSPPGSDDKTPASKNDGTVFGKLTEQLNHMRTAGGLGQSDESSAEEDDSDW